MHDGKLPSRDVLFAEERSSMSTGKVKPPELLRGCANENVALHWQVLGQCLA